MTTPALHVPQVLPPCLHASHSDHPAHYDRDTERSLKPGVTDGLIAITRQAWFPLLDAEDDDPEWPRND